MMTTIIIVAVFICVAALVGGVAIIFRGESTTAVEDRLQVLAGAGGAGLKEKSKSESSLLSSPLDDVPSMIEATLSRVLNLRVFLEQAGTTITPSKFLLVTAILAGVGAMVCVVSPVHFGFAPLAALIMALVPITWLFLKRKRRLSQFGKQLPEGLELIARALRAGHSLGSGIQLVANEMNDPIRSEFSRCFEEQNLGVPLEESLDNLTERVPNLDLRFFATAVILQRQTGGDLAEILDKIGTLVRERFKIWGQIQALTGEGRLSGIVLLALPPFLFIVMYRMNAEYVMMLFNDPLGQKMLAVAVVMQIIGALVIRQIINIKV